MAKTKEKAATHEYRALDVRSLNKAGGLSPGCTYTWEWRRQEEVVSSIDVHTQSRSSLRLSYQVHTEGQTEQKDYCVPITWTPCHLGGERPWFLCPCCNRRVATLYGGAVFACRLCWRLNYASQQTSKRDLASNRSRALRKALGCNYGVLYLPAENISKPKGMHWRTFERKIQQLQQVDAQALKDSSAKLDSIERRAGYALSRIRGQHRTSR